MKYYTTKQGDYPSKKNYNTQDEHFGDGWSVKKEGEKYFLTYISGSLQGELKTIAIQRDDFDSAKAGTVNLNDLCLKYNVT